MATQTQRIGAALLAVRRPGRRLVSDLVRFSRRKPLGAISLLILLGWIAVAIFAPYLPLADPLRTDVLNTLASPSWRHWAGTDEVGRDTLSRVMFAARLELRLTFSAVAMGTTGGSLLGLISGYYGGALDLVVQRLVDTLMALPGLVLAIALVSMKGAIPVSDDVLITIALAVVIAPGTARVVRGTVLSAKENVYVEASRAMGASNLRIIFRHILPNVTAPIIVVTSVTLGALLIAAATLSFLGVGVQPPTPSWGIMLSQSSSTYLERAPWLAIAPGVAISTVVFAFNLLGDALRDTLDPRLRGGR